MGYSIPSLVRFGQFLDPEDHIIFLKNETTLEEHLTKLENFTSYITNFEFLYIMANVSQPHVCYITLNHLDPIVEK